MKNDIFTLIAYRPNGIDTCRGCVMDRSDSDLDIRSYDSIEEVATSIFEYNEISRNSDREYCEYDLTVLINGYQRYETSDDSEGERIHNLFEMIDEYENIAKEKDKKKKEEAARLLEIKLKEERDRNAKLKAEEDERKRLEKIESDRKLYEELKLRFEQ